MSFYEGTILCKVIVKLHHSGVVLLYKKNYHVLCQWIFIECDNFAIFTPHKPDAKFVLMRCFFYVNKINVKKFESNLQKITIKIKSILTLIKKYYKEVKVNFLEEIKRIKGIERINVRKNYNPYRILTKDEQGIVAYYCNIPLYASDNKLLIPEWNKETTMNFEGVNAKITATEEKIYIGNSYGSAEVEFESDVTVEPTPNGIAVMCEGNRLKLLVKADSKKEVRQNGNFFALMLSEFCQFLTVSGMFGTDFVKFYPLNIENISSDGLNFELIISSFSEVKQLWFEIDLQVTKLFFDTTVESKNPEKNNVYGAVAFLGNTQSYGEQQLYLRFDTLQFLDLNSFSVESADLYLPRFYAEDCVLEAYKMEQPWCSFGSTWSNKVAYTDISLPVRENKDYIIVDVKEVMQDVLRYNEPRNPGLVIKKKNGSGYSVVATGDNYYRPQILEIKLRNY